MYFLGNMEGPIDQLRDTIPFAIRQSKANQTSRRKAFKTIMVKKFNQQI